MRKFLFLFFAASSLVLVSCHENLEERAQREAREYTAKNCPTPWSGCTRTDSVVFDIATLTYTYYCSVNDKMDNAELIKAHSLDITNGLRADVNQNTSLKAYKEAGFNFAYVLRSSKNPKQVLYSLTLTKKDYAQSVLPKAGGNVGADGAE